MTEIKKEFKLDEEDFTKRVFDYLKSNINFNRDFEDVLYRSLDNYHSLNHKDIMIAKKFLINLANQDNPLRFYNNDKTKDVLNAHKRDVEFYYYEQHFEITIEGSMIRFNHPERGRATYDMKHGGIWINGVSKPSLQGYLEIIV